MAILQAVEFSHYLITKQVSSGDFVIDATCGNGYDTGFIAEIVGKNGRVVAIDIQQEAINNTLSLLQEKDLNDQVDLIKGDHSKINSFIEEKPDLILFNLGYLPGGYKEVITRTESTLKACKKSLKLLIDGGLLVITAYPGHSGGREERNELVEWASDLDGKRYNVAHYHFLNQKARPPEVISIYKRN